MRPLLMFTSQFNVKRASTCIYTHAIRTRWSKYHLRMQIHVKKQTTPVGTCRHCQLLSDAS